MNSRVSDFQKRLINGWAHQDLPLSMTALPSAQLASWVPAYLARPEANSAAANRASALYSMCCAALCLVCVCVCLVCVCQCVMCVTFGEAPRVIFHSLSLSDEDTVNWPMFSYHSTTLHSITSDV
jgi:hypothetical protein